MPCYRCGARQADPARGPSPWKRGVYAGGQVLICPECQRGRDWTAELDACRVCGSTALYRALGETACRACGATGDGRSAARGEAEASAAAGASEALRDDVGAALDRVLRGGVV